MRGLTEHELFLSTLMGADIHIMKMCEAEKLSQSYVLKMLCFLFQPESLIVGVVTCLYY